MAEKSVHNDTYNTLKLNPVSADTGPSSGANDGASLYPSKSVLNAPRHPLLAFPPPSWIPCHPAAAWNQSLQRLKRLTHLSSPR